MLCSIKNKRGSVKFYLNKMPIDIINIINQHSTFKYHQKRNKKVLKQIKREVRLINDIDVMKDFLKFIRENDLLNRLNELYDDN